MKDYEVSNNQIELINDKMNKIKLTDTMVEQVKIISKLLKSMFKIHGEPSLLGITNEQVKLIK